MELLERDAALGELDAALRDATGGEAGIGKSALVECFVRRRGADVRVLWGASDALFAPRPLGPLHDMAPFFPEALRGLLVADAERGAVFAAVLAEMQRRPTVVVFEDVHWADEATLDLLRYLGRRIARTAALLVLTHRDDELEPRHPLRFLLGDVALRCRR
jgi:predicted ATPase